MWQVSFTKKSKKQFDALDFVTKNKIKKAVEKKLSINPDIELLPLLGEFSGYYKFRIGEYRLICHKDKTNFEILILKIGHRKNIYK